MGSRFAIRIVCVDCGHVVKELDRRDRDSGVPSDLIVDDDGRLACGVMSTAPETFEDE